MPRLSRRSSPLLARLAPFIGSVLALSFATPARADLDLVFLLDTTGSMSGELREAKSRVRQIADALAASRPGERVRTGVVAYRDRGDAYVTLQSDLSTDVSITQTFLDTLEAEGGGDGPEDVLSGLRVALDGMSWDRDDDVSREIFLIGDATAHLDYGHETPQGLIADAREAGILVHAIGCRSLSSRGIRLFRTLAYGTEGRYQHIGRVDVDRGGLTQALLQTLSASPPLTAPTPVALQSVWTVPADRVPQPIHGVSARLGAWTGPRDHEPHPDRCLLSVMLPVGADLADAPDVATSDAGLLVTLPLVSGVGGVRIFTLDPCLPAPVPVLVDLVEG